MLRPGRRAGLFGAELPVLMPTQIHHRPESTQVRPLSGSERAKKCDECVGVVWNQPEIVVGSGNRFTFDYVFGQNTRQHEIFDVGLFVSLVRFYLLTAASNRRSASALLSTLRSKALTRRYWPMARQGPGKPSRWAAPLLSTCSKRSKVSSHG